MTFKELVLDDGTVLQVNVLVKTWSCLIVRTEDNRYLMISKYHMTNPEAFGFKDDFKGYEDKSNDQDVVDQGNNGDYNAEQ